MKLERVLTGVLAGFGIASMLLGLRCPDDVLAFLFIVLGAGLMTPFMIQHS